MSRSKPWPEGFPGDPRKRCKDIIDDGFSAHLVAKSRFDGIMEIPVIEKPDEIVIPDGMTPFSKVHRAKDLSGSCPGLLPGNPLKIQAKIKSKPTAPARPLTT